jgi:hypothetical protein
MADRRPEVLVVSIIFFALATVFVALRFVSRIFVVRRVGLHDYLMLLAWVCRALVEAFRSPRRLPGRIGKPLIILS